MRLLPILAAAGIGLIAATAVNAQGMGGGVSHGAGNPTGAQNMDTSNRGNPNRPTAGQMTTSGTRGGTHEGMTTGQGGMERSGMDRGMHKNSMSKKNKKRSNSRMMMDK